MAGGSGGQIKGQIGDVAQPPPLDHDGEHLAGLALAERADRLDHLLQGEVIDAVDIARAQRHGGEAAWQRLAGDDGDMGHPPLAAADQFQRLGAGILRAVGPDGPFAGHIGMEDRLAIVGGPQRGEQGGAVIDEGLGAIDGSVILKIAGDDDVGEMM